MGTGRDRVDDDEAGLALRATEGDRAAFGTLFDHWFDRAYDVAWNIVRNRETAADVTQDAFVAAWQQIDTLRQPASFGGWLLRITRNRALNRLQKEQRSRPTGSEDTLVSIDRRTGDDPTLTHEQREHGELVWAASAALGADDTSLLDLHLRHGLSVPELAEELEVKPNAAHQRLFRLKKRLADAIGAWVLWRHGLPACDELDAELNRIGASGFDAATARAIGTHARSCPDCETRRAGQLSPEALFAATPLVVAEPLLRAEVAAALEGMGVPVPPGATGTGTGSDAPPSRSGRGPARSERSFPRLMAGAGIGAATLALGTLATIGLLADRAGDGTAPGTTTPPESAPEPPPATSTTTTTPQPAPTPPERAVAADPRPGTDPAPSDTTAPATTVPGDGGGEEPAPAILRFTSRAAPNQPCTSQEVPVELVWASEDATSATIGPEAGPAATASPSGTAQRCAAPGSTWVLTVTGPGGSDEARTTVETPPEVVLR